MQNNSLFDKYISSQMKFTRQKQRSLAGKQRRFMVNFVHNLPGKDASILDLGPGYGELLLLLSQLGYNNLLAIDISPEVVSYCNELMPGSTLLVSNPTAYFEAHPNTYDAVCASHVLEHVPKDEVIPLLQAIRKALKPTGRLIVEVPNGDAVLANIMRYGDFTHQISYTERSLRQIMLMAGYTDINIMQAKLPLDHPLRLLQITAQKIIFGLVKLLCRVLDTYVPNYLHTSIVCIAKN